MLITIWIYIQAPSLSWLVRRRLGFLWVFWSSDTWRSPEIRSFNRACVNKNSYPSIYGQQTWVNNYEVMNLHNILQVNEIMCTHTNSQTHKVKGNWENKFGLVVKKSVNCLHKINSQIICYINFYEFYGHVVTYMANLCEIFEKVAPIFAWICFEFFWWCLKIYIIDPPTFNFLF